MKISFLVVLYNCRLDDSQSLKSLSTMNTETGATEFSLCVWNNGPNSCDFTSSEILMALKKNGWIIFFKESINNRPLSKIYNEFINSARSDRYIILDHDSIIMESYISAVCKKEAFNLMLPRIKVNDDILFPLKNSIPIKHDCLVSSAELMSIGSGLCIDKSLINSMQEEIGSVFDENFALYGVDTTFFIRLQRVSHNSKILCSGDVYHSLSRLEVENNKITKMRSLERAYDLALMLRHYPSLNIINVLIRIMIGRILRKNKFPILPIIVCYLRGRHHRC